MAGFTKRAIINTFFKMLEERPLNKITVTDIVKECGINRNSFYYHYEDIPSLLKDWMRSEFKKAIAEHSTEDKSIAENIEVFISFVLDNKRLLLRIFNSVGREIFEEGLREKSKDWAVSYVKHRFAGVNLKASEQEKIVEYYNFLFFGMFFSWFTSGLKKSAVKNYKEYIELNDVAILNTYARRQ